MLFSALSVHGKGSALQQLNLTLFNNNGHNLHNEQQRSFYVHEQQTARNSVGTSDILYTYFNNGASEVKLNVERDPMLPPLCYC